MIVPMRPHHVAEVVALRTLVAPDSFITSLGEEVQSIIFQELCDPRYALAHVWADKAIGILGNIGVILVPYTMFFRGVGAKHPIALSWSLLKALIRRPRLLRRLIPRMIHVARPARDLKDQQTRRWAALISINVREDQRGKGIADALVRACCDELRRRGYAELVTTAFSDNGRAIRVFERVGFRQDRVFRHWDGREMAGFVKVL